MNKNKQVKLLDVLKCRQNIFSGWDVQTQFTVGVHALIRNPNGEYLLTKRSSSDSYKPNVWDIPGGTITAGEIAEAALAREIIEETKIQRFGIGQVIHVYTNLDSFPTMQNIQIIYECEVLSFICDVSLSNDHSEYVWCKHTDFNKYELIPFLKDYLARDTISELSVIDFVTYFDVDVSDMFK